MRLIQSFSLYNFVRKYFTGDNFQTLLKNAAKVLSGNSLAAVINLLAMALAARALGVAGFGALALIGAYVLLISGLANLNSWQALIKFGAVSIHDENYPQLATWIKLCALVDIISHIVGFLVCLAVLALMGHFLYASDESLALAYVFSIVILFQAVSDTASGMLRLFGDFTVLALSAPIIAVVTFLGFAFNYWQDLGLSAYIFVQLMASFCGAAYIASSAWHVLRMRNLPLRLGSGFSLIQGHVKSFLKFLLITNITSSVSLVAKRGDIVLLGALLGEVAVGLYRVVKIFSSVPSLMLGPLYMAIYPQFTEMFAQKKLDDFKKLGIQSSLLAGALATAYWLGYTAFGFSLIELAFGKDYTEAWVVGIFYLLGTVISGFALPLTPAILSYGRPALTLRAHLAANIIYFTLMVVLLQLIGLVAAGIAYLVYYLVWALTTLYYVVGCHRLERMRA